MKSEREKIKKLEELGWPLNLLNSILDGEKLPDKLPKDFNGSLSYVLETTLSEKRRRAVIMRYKSIKTYSEIGKSLGITETAANKLVADSVRRIRMYYKDFLLLGMNQYLYSRIKTVLDTRVNDEVAKEVKRQLNAVEHSIKEKFNDLNKQVCMCFSELSTSDIVHECIISDSEKTQSYLKQTRLSDLPLLPRTKNTLFRGGCYTVADVLDRGKEVLKIRNLGNKCVSDFVRCAKDLGIDTREFEYQIKEV